MNDFANNKPQFVNQVSTEIPPFEYLFIFELLGQLASSYSFTEEPLQDKASRQGVAKSSPPVVQSTVVPRSALHLWKSP